MVEGLNSRLLRLTYPNIELRIMPLLLPLLSLLLKLQSAKL